MTSCCSVRTSVLSDTFPESRLPASSDEYHKEECRVPERRQFRLSCPIRGVFSAAYILQPFTLGEGESKMRAQNETFKYFHALYLSTIGQSG